MKGGFGAATYFFKRKTKTVKLLIISTSLTKEEIREFFNLQNKLEEHENKL